MTAKYVVFGPIEGEVGDVWAIAADDTSARYVFQDGSDSGLGGLDSARIADFADRFGTPTNADGWLELAALNTGYTMSVSSGTAETLDAAVAAAVGELATAAVPAAGPDDFAVPTTRAELLVFQQRGMATWAEQYPEAAAGDVDDPEADLALVHLMTLPVNPEKSHKWLPIATTETDCGFCEQPEDAAIHTAGADTITRGSN